MGDIVGIVGDHSDGRPAISDENRSLNVKYL